MEFSGSNVMMGLNHVCIMEALQFKVFSSLRVCSAYLITEIGSGTCMASSDSAAK